MEAIVLAGGRGSRLASRLDGIPKPMVSVGGRPFLEIVLGRLHQGGCTRVILSVGYLHQVIIDHFGERFKGMDIEYVVEQDPLGTGGALRQALKFAREPNILVLNGDTLVDISYSGLLSWHSKNDVELTIAVVHQPDVSRYGGLTIQGDRIAAFSEKGRSGSGAINAGVYALKSNLVWPATAPDRFSFESDFVMTELPRLKPLAYQCSGYFLDVGVPSDLDRAQTELALS